MFALFGAAIPLRVPDYTIYLEQGVKITRQNLLRSKRHVTGFRRQTRKNIADEWIGFRVGRWMGQIFNFRLLCKKFLQNQQDRYVDCTKAFDRYCKKPNLIRVKESKRKSTWRPPDCGLPWWQQRRPVRQRSLFLQSLSLTSSST